MEETLEQTTARRLRDAYPFEVNLGNCDEEPLRHIQLTQPHACVLGVETATLRVTHASDNAEAFLGRPAAEVLGSPLIDLLEGDVIATIHQGVERGDFEAINPIRTYRPADGASAADGDRHDDDDGGAKVAMQAVCHLVDDGARLLVELEHAGRDYHSAAVQRQLGRAVEAVQRLTDYDRMFDDAARIVRSITGYDRVMVYRFDADLNGQVIGEARRDDLEAFRNLRYPASDIPRTAREAYRRNRVRMISDTVGEQSRLLVDPAAAAHPALDLLPAAARGMSPVHGEYLSGMGVKATCSLAIMLDDRLWGLFAMHHYEGPRVLDQEMRAFLEFLGRVFSGHLALQSASEYRERILEVNVLRSRLGDQISESQDLAAALVDGTVSVLDLLPDTHGAAVSVEGEIKTLGRAPSLERVHALASYVAEHSDNPLYYASDCLGDDYAGACDIAEEACGVLLLWLERDRREYIAWFRQEIVRRVEWGGRPEKHRVELEGGGFRLAPRKSFAKYSQLVEGRCEPWTESNVDAALALRSHVKDVVMRRYQQVKRVNSELASAYQEMETFSYTVSHDLRAPLRGISGYAEIILEDYGARLDDEGRDMLRSISANTDRMNTFIDELLQLSKVGVSALELKPVDLARLAHRVFADIYPGFAGQRTATLAVADDLPEALGDPRLLTVALTNLISNAIKYGKPDGDASTEITVGFTPDAPVRGVPAYFVQDDGVGFDERHAEGIFEMFTRLHDDTDVEGNGVGLALVHRVITKHGGELWATSSPGVGSTFYFTLQPA